MALRAADPGVSTAAVPGLAYAPEFLSPAEENELLARLETLPFADVRMHGVVARRRVAHFGWDYTYDSARIHPTTPLPEWLRPLRTRAAELAGRDAEAFAETLVTLYPPGAGIGWHRDAPAFGPVLVGVSLGGAAVMRLRPGPAATRQEVVRLSLAPRSAYVLSGPARATWQHTLPPVKQLRYSVTFRTLAARRASG